VPRLRYTDAAQADLRSIARYVAMASQSRATAASFITRLRAHCTKLAALPGTLGQARPELHPEVRSTPFRGYVIFFRYCGSTLEIVNVLEGHRDILAHFDERGSLDS
jgi:toxin ParE1/3/4